MKTLIFLAVVETLEESGLHPANIDLVDDFETAFSMIQDMREVRKFNFYQIFDF